MHFGNESFRILFNISFKERNTSQALSLNNRFFFEYNLYKSQWLRPGLSLRIMILVDILKELVGNRNL